MYGAVVTMNEKVWDRVRNLSEEVNKEYELQLRCIDTIGTIDHILSRT
jgi:hypothetical protein